MTTKIPKLKLTYFDFDGGRGEPIRLTLSYGKVPFEDDRIPGSDWPAMKEKTPLHQLPVMEVDGQAITQTNTLLRYVGKLAGLYPEDALQAAQCDETMGIIEDISIKIFSTMFMQDEEEKRQAREALAAGPIPLFLRRLETILKERGGKYFAGGRLSVADIKAYLWARYLQSGVLDHIPTDMVKKSAPTLAEHCERISAQPEFVAYYKQRAL